MLLLGYLVWFCMRVNISGNTTDTCAEVKCQFISLLSYGGDELLSLSEGFMRAVCLYISVSPSKPLCGMKDALAYVWAICFDRLREMFDIKEPFFPQRKGNWMAFLVCVIHACQAVRVSLSRAKLQCGLGFLVCVMLYGSFTVKAKRNGSWKTRSCPSRR